MRSVLNVTKTFFNFGKVGPVVNFGTTNCIVLFQITVRAKDGGRENALQSTCTIEIVIDDVNDNWPQFVKPKKRNDTFYATTAHDHVILKVQVISPPPNLGDVPGILIEKQFAFTAALRNLVKEFTLANAENADFDYVWKCFSALAFAGKWHDKASFIRVGWFAALDFLHATRAHYHTVDILNINIKLFRSNSACAARHCRDC